MSEAVQEGRLVRWCVLRCEGVFMWCSRANFVVNGGSVPVGECAHPGIGHG